MDSDGVVQVKGDIYVTGVNNGLLDIESAINGFSFFFLAGVIAAAIIIRGGLYELAKAIRTHASTLANTTITVRNYSYSQRQEFGGRK